MFARIMAGKNMTATLVYQGERFQVNRTLMGQFMRFFDDDATWTDKLEVTISPSIDLGDAKHLEAFFNMCHNPFSCDPSKLEMIELIAWYNFADYFRHDQLLPILERHLLTKYTFVLSTRPDVVRVTHFMTCLSTKKDKAELYVHMLFLMAGCVCVQPQCESAKRLVQQIALVDAQLTRDLLLAVTARQSLSGSALYFQEAKKAISEALAMAQRNLDVSKCIEQKQCTFAATGTLYANQAFYYCKTCFGDKENLGCCEVCVSLCHANHKVVLSASSVSSFCDCGAAVQGCVQCKCLLSVANKSN